MDTIRRKLSKKKNKTFLEKVKHNKGSKRYELHKKAKETLSNGDLFTAVKLPQGESREEWMAANTIDFFNQVNFVYGGIMEYCTHQSCPVMSAGSKFEYLWSEEPSRHSSKNTAEKAKKPIKLPAPDYIDALLKWVHEKLNDEELFPSNGTFPEDFVPQLTKIFRRLFRVYAHLYYSHYDQMLDLGTDKHINTCLKHFYLFSEEFSLIEKKELVPLQTLIDNLLNNKDQPLTSLKSEKSEKNGKSEDSKLFLLKNFLL